MSLIFNTSEKFNFNPSKRYIGTEIELAYMDTARQHILEEVVGKWHGDWGYDGSIESRRNYKDRMPVDIELRLAPTNGDLFVQQMLEYGKAFRETKSTTNNSCGLHIHVDARDLNDDHLDNVLMLWSKIEEPLYSIISPRRKKAHWCKAWNFKNKNIVDIHNKITRNGQSYLIGNQDAWGYKRHSEKLTNKIKALSAIKSNSLHTERYSALNLVALSSHGTLENRMHHGTTNVTNIINWGIINASLVDFAKSNTMESIEKMRNGWYTLMEVAPTKEVRKWAMERRESWKNNPTKTINTERRVG